MNSQEIYELAIEMGIKNDPRGEKRVEEILKKRRKDYQELSPAKKKYYDKEKFTNPYSDTRLFWADSKIQVKRVLAGIDIEVGEVMLAEELGKRGKPSDLIISHHPDGKALAELSEVLELQADMLADLGIAINIAESLLEKRISEVSRRFHPFNHYEALDAARLLGFQSLCVHTPCDNLVYQFVKRHLEKKKPEYVEEVLDALAQIYEYDQAAKAGVGPTLFAGDPKRRAGKVALTEITGGTSGAKEIYEQLSHHAGVGTIVGMHMSEEYKEEAEKHHLNVVIAGHMASDSLGMNIFLDELQKRGIEVIPCSGLIRKSK